MSAKQAAKAPKPSQRSVPLSCGTLSYRQQPLDRALDGIARAGFGAVEIGCVCGYCEHVKPDQMRLKDMDSLGRAVKQKMGRGHSRGIGTPQPACSTKQPARLFSSPKMA